MVSGFILRSLLLPRYDPGCQPVAEALKPNQTQPNLIREIVNAENCTDHYFYFNVNIQFTCSSNPTYGLAGCQFIGIPCFWKSQMLRWDPRGNWQDSYILML